MLKIRLITFFLGSALLAFGAVASPVSSIFAQPGSTCTPLVERALAEMGENCSAMSRNEACYGYNRVGAEFAQEVTENVFAAPSDRAGLLEMRRIETAPLDEQLETWGIAVMNVQANVPNSLPGQNVVFVLLGDTQVENLVPAEDAALPSDALVPVTMAAQANIRSLPSRSANVLGTSPAGSTLEADAIDASQGWLRVVFEGSPAWVSREVIQDADLSTLPVIEGEQRTPMQAFYFTTGPGVPTCQDAPDALLVQGPEGIAVDITANGADIRIGSTILLQTIIEGTDENGNPIRLLRLVTISGAAYLDGVIVPAGFQVVAPVDENNNVIGPWTNLRPLTPEELEALKFLELIPEDVMNYPPIPPTPEEIQRLLNELNGASGNGVISGPASGRADCSNFRATSPLSGAAYGVNAFYWDPAPGATSYTVNVYGQNGNNIGSFSTAAPNTSVSGDVGGAGEFNMSWEVQAFVDGQIACSTQRVTVARSSEPPPPPPPDTVNTVTYCVMSPTACPAACTWTSAGMAMGCYMYYWCTCPV